MNTSRLDVNSILRRLKTYLDKSRYTHTLGVQTTAITLAEIHKINITQAQTAALLHDCARSFPLVKQKDIWSRYPEYLDDEEKLIPELWHAPVSALVAKTDFQITDPDILAAIRYHSTGRPRMTPLEQIIYIADFIEPNRTIDPIQEEAAKLAFTDLIQATLFVTESKLQYLKQANKPIHHRGIETRDYLEKQIQAKTTD